MMAPTDDLFFRRSYPSLEPPCFRRIDHLSQVWSRTYCDDLWVAPIGRLQAHLACRMSGLGSTPIPSSIAEPRTAFRCKPRLHRTSYSRLALAGRLSSHRVKLNDPSNEVENRRVLSTSAVVITFPIIPSQTGRATFIASGFPDLLAFPSQVLCTTPVQRWYLVCF
jgi:hypothetical protein